MTSTVSSPPLPDLSIVLPCYNEADMLSNFIDSVALHAQSTGIHFEVVAINDGSSDGTGDVLEGLKETRPWLRVIHFSRNFGHMAALSAGIDHAFGTKAVITMDSDGQHPPELIPTLVRAWGNGADIVQTIRVGTANETFKKKITSTLFYGLLNRLGETYIKPGSADFRLMSKQVVTVLRSLPEKTRFLRGLIYWVGFKMEYLEYHAESRLAGKSKYNLTQMLKFAVDGISSFSTVLLKISIFSGIITVSVASLYALYILALYCFYPDILVTGWSSIMLVMLFLGGFNLIAIGVLGEYISRIYVEVKNRPIYIIRDGG